MSHQMRLWNCTDRRLEDSMRCTYNATYTCWQGLQFFFGQTQCTGTNISFRVLLCVPSPLDYDT